MVDLKKMSREEIERRRARAYDNRTEVARVAAAAAWSKPEYPGSPVRMQMLRRDDELGDVRIQWYGPASFHVGSFLPGRTTCSPGDTPKTAPEIDEWCETEGAANAFFDVYVLQAREDGWEDYTS